MYHLGTTKVKPLIAHEHMQFHGNPSKVWVGRWYIKYGTKAAMILALGKVGWSAAMPWKTSRTEKP